MSQPCGQAERSEYDAVGKLSALLGNAQQRITDLERQLAEAQAHVRNHHLEPCETCAANESERDALNAEVERLAECRCTDHWDAPAVDGCGVCVREHNAVGFGENNTLRERLATAFSTTAGQGLAAMQDVAKAGEKIKIAFARTGEGMFHALHCNFTSPERQKCNCGMSDLVTALATLQAALSLSPTTGREFTAMRAALCAMLIWVNGEPHYHTSGGIPMEMPYSVQRKVARALREFDFKPGKDK